MTQSGFERGDFVLVRETVPTWGGRCGTVESVVPAGTCRVKTGIAELWFEPRELLHATAVAAPVDDGRAALAPDLPSHPAGADEPEADPPQRIAADPSVVDSESDTVYGDAVQHGSEYRPEARGEAGRAEEVPHDGRASARPAQSEHERQAWLRRVQAQPIR